MVEINYLKSIMNDILKQYKNLIRLSLDNEEHDFTNLTSRVKMLYLKAQNIMIFFTDFHRCSEMLIFCHRLLQ